MIRRVLVCLLSQLLCVPANRIVPLLFEWRNTVADSVTRPIKRKQLPMASLAYLFETQDDAIHLPVTVEKEKSDAEKSDASNQRRQFVITKQSAIKKSPRKIARQITTMQPVAEERLLQVVRGPPSS